MVSSRAAMKHLVTAAALLLTFLFAAPRVAEACSCMMQSPEDAATGADAIFEGRVTGIESASDQSSPVRVRIHVTQQWKGLESQEEVEVTTAANSAMCGYTFEAEQVYLVYAARDEEGALTVSLCSRTRLADQADEDRQHLGPGTTPVDPAVVDPGTPEPADPQPTTTTHSANASAQAGCASCHVAASTEAGWILPALLLLPWVRRRR